MRLDGSIWASIWLRQQPHEAFLRMPLIIAVISAMCALCTVHAPKNKARRANFERKDLEINWKPVPEKNFSSVKPIRLQKLVSVNKIMSVSAAPPHRDRRKKFKKKKSSLSESRLSPFCHEAKNSVTNSNLFSVQIVIESPLLVQGTNLGGATFFLTLFFGSNSRSPYR
jgi:hypothetical protein